MRTASVFGLLVGAVNSLQVDFSSDGKEDAINFSSMEKLI